MPDYAPDANGNFFASYNMSATAILGAHKDGNGNNIPAQTAATVVVQPSPLVAAQMVVLAFEDNHPLNGEPDQDGEAGLPGFQVRIDDAGGRYGQIGGQISVDVFGNPLGTTYVADPSNPSGYQIDPTTHQPMVAALGSGTILTDANGYAVVKNLPPGKYGVTLLPPNGTDWIQTSTIEGQHANDAWVKFHEPPFFAEFGPPGPHVFAGFISPSKIAADPVSLKALSGGATFSGRITVNHMNAPPHYGFNSGSILEDTTCWVGLNQTSSNSTVAVQPCNPDGTFGFSNLSPGAYTMGVFDSALDVIFGTYGFTVDASGATCNNGGSCAVGDVPQFTWFNRLEAGIFYDPTGKGFPDGSSRPIPELKFTIRFRDGSVDQSILSDEEGLAAFPETFPYFNWQVLEVDSSRFKSTGVTVVVDAGGPVPADSGWNLPSEGKLNPQAQYNTLDASGNKRTSGATPIPNPNAGGSNLSRTDAATLTTPINTQAFQGFTTGTNRILFGKTSYGPGENGGISGMVAYGTTRAEDDPRYLAIEGFEPGIPHVNVIIYKKPATGTKLNLADIASFTNTPLQTKIAAHTLGKNNVLLNTAKGDVKRSKTGGATNFDFGDAVGYGWTDGWDDNLPTNCQGEVYVTPLQVTADGTPKNKPLDCYDGLRNWNQVRPGTYDGHFQILTDINGNPLPAGEYVVEVFAPRYGNANSAYRIVKEEDKNVLNGVDFVPANVPPACIGDQTLVDPNQYYYGQAGTVAGFTPSSATPTAVDPTVYPMPHVVPQYLSLFPMSQKPAPLAGQTRPLCMFKDVQLSTGQNAQVNYEFYTEVPIAGHFVGIILNDLGNEFDVTSPNFGEKAAPAWVPVAIRDSNGQELYRIYADEWGTYSGLVPSTMTASVPIPTGNSPSIMTLCMNDPGPIADPANPGQMIRDPHFLPQFSQFCYTLAYLQGTTTYLDTPVVPVASFTSLTKGQVDCDFVTGTPKILSVVNTTDSIPGPVIPSDKGAGRTTTLTITAMGNTKVPNPNWGGPGSGTPSTEARDYGFGGTTGTVTIGGVPIPVSNGQWKAGSITLNVTSALFKQIANLPGGAGELVITRGDNGKSTVNSVTVIANAASTAIHVVPAPVINPVSNNVATPVSDTIAAANSGDVVVLGPGTYQEMVIMTKPVQIAGAGAGSVFINPAKTRTDALTRWRSRVQTLLTATPPAADLLPGQELDFSVPEPGTLNTEEGAGILVLGQATASRNDFGKLTNKGAVKFPARIDGVSVYGADNGGGITANGYVHNLEVSNDHIFNNTGAYGGGLRIGVPLLISANANGTDVYVSGQNDNAYIHHNSITSNGGQSSSGGGVQLCTGADNYRVQYNFICGNFMTGHGGGIGHEGLSNNGLIDHNTILFNQVFDQSANDNGGGISIASETSLGANGLRTGTGNVTVSNNMIQGNQAGSGNGGGISLDGVNGADVAANPANSAPVKRADPPQWYGVTILNNMIVDNVAAWRGGGIAMQDVAGSAIINDTISNNQSTATAGAAFPAGMIGPNGAQQSTPQVAGVVSLAHSAALQAVLPASAKDYANPVMRNDIITQNQAQYFKVTSNTPGAYGLLVYGDWNLGVVGSKAPGVTLAPASSVVDTPNGSLTFTDPYFNTQPGITVQQTEPTNGLPLVQPAFDEGGNFIDMVYWPLTQTDYAKTATLFSYLPVAATSTAIVGKGDPSVLTAYPATLTDIYGASRAGGVDIGAAQAK